MKLEDKIQLRDKLYEYWEDIDIENIDAQDKIYTAIEIICKDIDKTKNLKRCKNE